MHQQAAPQRSIESGFQKNRWNRSGLLSPGAYGRRRYLFAMTTNFFQMFLTDV